MHKPESVLVNEIHKILRDFVIQTDTLIPARRPDLVIIDKKKGTCHVMDFVILVDRRMNLEFFRELRKLWNMGVMVIPIVTGALRMVPKGLVKGKKILTLEDESRPLLRMA